MNGHPSAAGVCHVCCNQPEGQLSFKAGLVDRPIPDDVDVLLLLLREVDVAVPVSWFSFSPKVIMICIQFVFLCSPGFMGKYISMEISAQALSQKRKKSTGKRHTHTQDKHRIQNVTEALLPTRGRRRRQSSGSVRGEHVRRYTSKGVIAAAFCVQRDITRDY